MPDMKRSRPKLPLTWLLRGIMAGAIVVFGIWLLIRTPSPAPDPPDSRAGIIRLAIPAAGTIHAMVAEPLGLNELVERYERVGDEAAPDAEPKLVLHADRRAPAAAVLFTIAQARAHGIGRLHMATKDTHGIDLGLPTRPLAASLIADERAALRINREGELFIGTEPATGVGLTRLLARHRDIEADEQPLVVLLDPRLPTGELVRIITGNLIPAGIERLDLRPLDGGAGLLTARPAPQAAPPDAGIPLGEPVMQRGEAADRTALLDRAASLVALQLTRRLRPDAGDETAISPDGYFTLGPLPADRTVSPTAGEALDSIYTHLGGEEGGWNYIVLNDPILQPPGARGEAAFFAATAIHVAQSAVRQLTVLGDVTDIAVAGQWLGAEDISPITEGGHTPGWTVTIQMQAGWTPILLRLAHASKPPKAAVFIEPVR